MTAKPRRPARARGGHAQDALFPAGRTARGRVERGVDAYLSSRRSKNDPVDPAAAALLRASARGLDYAETERSPWSIAAASKALREAYLVVDGAQAPPPDQLDALLAAFASPQLTEEFPDGTEANDTDGHRRTR